MLDWFIVYLDGVINGVEFGESAEGVVERTKNMLSQIANLTLDSSAQKQIVTAVKVSAAPFEDFVRAALLGILAQSMQEQMQRAAIAQAQAQSRAVGHIPGKKH